MPRTKRPVNRKEKATTENDETLKKMTKLVNDLKKQVDMRAQMYCREMDVQFKILLGSLSDNILQKTVGELKSELRLKQVPSATRSASHDDGYLTANSSQDSGDMKKRNKGQLSSSGRPTTRRSQRRSQSADPSARKQCATAAKPVQRRRSKSVYRTPAYNKKGGDNYPAITPKVAPNMPLTLLRQPRQGEMVVSMSGSPVLVPTYNNIQPDESANCNIKLKDGTVLSLHSNPLRKSSAFIPFSLMDNNMLLKIKTLKDNLDTVVKMGERAFK